MITSRTRAPNSRSIFEKARGVYGHDAKPFEARLETKDGADYWHVKSLEDANAARVIEASKEGLSSREIAKELGVAIPRSTGSAASTSSR